MYLNYPGKKVHALQAGFKHDHNYYKEQGWLTSDYYYQTKLGWLKKMIGAWADKQAIKQIARSKKE